MAEYLDFEVFTEKRYARRYEDIEINIKDENDNNIVKLWRCQNLTAEDLSEAELAVEKNKNLKALIDIAVAASAVDKVKDKIDAIKAVLGINDKVPDNLVRKYVIFELGSPDIKVKNRQKTIYFAAHRPIEFNQIVNKIYELTSMGGIAKKKP